MFSLYPIIHAHMKIVSSIAMAFVSPCFWSPFSAPANADLLSEGILGRLYCYLKNVLVPNVGYLKYPMEEIEFAATALASRKSP